MIQLHLNGSKPNLLIRVELKKIKLLKNLKILNYGLIKFKGNLHQR